MTVTEVAYCTRAMVQRQLTIADVPRFNARIDAAIQAGARDLEGQLHRVFYPETKTVAFDMPDGTNLWLDNLELTSTPTQILSGAQQMTVGTDVYLRPRQGPPYRWLEVGYAGTVFWESVNTTQNAISITGDFGYPTTTIGLTTLAGSITNSAGTLTVADSSQISPGMLVLIDSERILVSDASLAVTGATLAADLAGQKSSTILTVSDGTKINVGELLYIDSERMDVQSISGNIVVVDRAVNASVLAAHSSGTTIYAPRTLVVLRSRLGTSAASHSNAATVSWLKPPSLITEANMALAINNIEQGLGAYARTLGSQASQRDQPGRGVQDIIDSAYARYGRKNRMRAV